MKKKTAKFEKNVIRKGLLYYLIRFFAPIMGITTAIFLGSLFLNKFSAQSCANSISCIKNLTVQVENEGVGVYEGKEVIPPKIDLAQEFQKPKVLGTELPAGPKHIYVDLTTQTLSAYQGDKLVMKTFVSTGRWGKTPTGEFTIWVKLRATRMSGGQGADYYNLPNVPYVMFFSNNEVSAAKGFSLHGAYWHNNFGYTMSHGCVNMRIIDAEAIYNWADPITTANTTHATKDNPGTVVTIYGQPII